jgi:undecaprenyl-diphosphatase
VPLDLEIYHAINSFRGQSPALDSFMLVFEVRVLRYIYLPLLAVLWFTRNPKIQRAVLVTIGVIALAIVLRPIVKDIYFRPRPWTEFGCTDLAPCYNDNSFPSGHVMVATATLATLWRSCRAAGLLMLFVVIATAISRIYLAEHYPTDTLAGAVVGMAIGGFALWLSNRPPFDRAISRALGLSQRMRMTRAPAANVATLAPQTPRQRCKAGPLDDLSTFTESVPRSE